jgi:hypothetical protein
MRKQNGNYSIDLVQHRQKLRHYNQLDVELAKRKLKFDNPDDDDIIKDIREQMNSIDI